MNVSVNNESTLLVDKEKEIALLVSLGAVAITILPLTNELCKKFGMTREQITYLKLHYKNNPRTALNELLEKLKERREITE